MGLVCNTPGRAGDSSGELTCIFHSRKPTDKSETASIRNKGLSVIFRNGKASIRRTCSEQEAPASGEGEAHETNWSGVAGSH